jgi:galactokinase
MTGVMHVHAPGRVNLIGDHTDYAGGRALPMAIDLGVSLECERAEGHVELRSASEREAAMVPLDLKDPSAVEPARRPAPRGGARAARVGS